MKNGNSGCVLFSDRRELFWRKLYKVEVGNTEKAANMVAKLTGGKLLRIEQAEPYSEHYQTCIAQAKQDL